MFPRIMVHGFSNMGIEVAIWALGRAERPMNIYAETRIAVSFAHADTVPAFAQRLPLCG